MATPRCSCPNAGHDPRPALPWPLLRGVLPLLLGNGRRGAVPGPRGLLGGYGAQTASWGMSAYFAGFLPGARLAPRMIRRVGHVRVFAAPGATTSAAFVPYAKAVHPPPG